MDKNNKLLKSLKEASEHNLSRVKDMCLPRLAQYVADGDTENVDKYLKFINMLLRSVGAKNARVKELIVSGATIEEVE